MSETAGLKIFVGPANQLEMGTVTTGPAAAVLTPVTQTKQRLDLTIPAPTADVVAAAQNAEAAAAASATSSAGSKTSATNSATAAASSASSAQAAATNAAAGASEALAATVAEAEEAKVAAQQAAALVGAPAGAAVVAAIQPGGAAHGVLSAAYASRPKKGKNALTGWYHIDGYGADLTGASNSVAAVNEAGLDAENDGGGRVYFPVGRLRLDSGIIPRSNVEFYAVEGQCVLWSPNNIHAFTNPTKNITDFTIDGLGAEGTRPDPGAYPTRGPAGIGSIPAGLRSLGDIHGSLDPNGAYKVMRNVTVRNCRVKHVGSLPITIGGAAGIIRVEGNNWENTLDPGITYTSGAQAVIYSRNITLNGGDNGVSISRGCNNITVSDNHAIGCALYGIWVAGYVDVGLGIADPGPRTFTVTGNVIKNCGRGGMGFRDAPRFGTITGNTVDGISAGPSTTPSMATAREFTSPDSLTRPSRIRPCSARRCSSRITPSRTALGAESGFGVLSASRSPTTCSATSVGRHCTTERRSYLRTRAITMASTAQTRPPCPASSLKITSSLIHGKRH